MLTNQQLMLLICYYYFNVDAIDKRKPWDWANVRQEDKVIVILLWYHCDITLLNHYVITLTPTNIEQQTPYNSNPLSKPQ